jgi:hypothetical protein
MGLVRGMARTAVVAGTATAVSNRVSRRQANRWSEQEAASYQSQAPTYEPPPPPQVGTEDKLAQLKELGELKEAGVLTGAEFEQQKAKILAS